MSWGYGMRVFRIWLKSLSFLLLGWAPAATAKEILDLYVQEELPVYSKPTETATVISRLNRGDQVVVSPKFYGSFRKVLVTYKGRSIGGYVPGRLLVRSYVKSRADMAKEKGERKRYGSRYSLGLALVGSYLRQGESTFQLSDTLVYDTTAFQSFTTFFSVFLDKPLAATMGLRSYVSFRQTRFEGRVTERDSLSPTPMSPKTTRQQSLTGVGLVLRNYGRPNSNWWWGGGGELAMGNKVTIKFDGIAVTPEEEEKPVFAILFGAIGGDVALPISRSLYLVPDLRLGSVLSTKPITLYAETFLGIAYQF